MALFAVPELNSRKGTYRAYHLAAIIFVTAFLSGYDAGVAGGILTYASFEKDFSFDASSKSKVSSLTVGLQQLGSFVGAAASYPLMNKFGRKWTIVGATAIFMVGAIIQTINTGSLGAWYFARIVAGLGVGAQTVIIPSYSAEMTPKEIRGRCGSFYQWLYTWGVFLAYWINYGCANSPSLVGKSREWQIPVGLQMVSGGVMLIGMLTLPESIRWLLTQERKDDAWKALVWIRGDDGEKTREEFVETQLGLRAEAIERQGFKYRELLEPANRIRFLLGPALFVFQNATGSSALAVFAPQYFTLLVGDSKNRNLLLTGLFGAVKLIASTFFIWVLSERLSRRVTLISGAAVMAAAMMITALIVDETPTQSSDSVTSAGRATVAMIYIDIMIYNCSWGPLPWAYAPEIFPTRMRAHGLAASMLWHWASSFCFSFASPYMITNLGANTFFIFMGFDVLAAIFCFFFVKETRGKNLEIAAGTEWEVAERSADEDEKRDAVIGTDGKAVEIVEVHTNFHTALKKRAQ